MKERLHDPCHVHQVPNAPHECRRGPHWQDPRKDDASKLSQYRLLAGVADATPGCRNVYGRVLTNLWSPAAAGTKAGERSHRERYRGLYTPHPSRRTCFGTVRTARIRWFIRRKRRDAQQTRVPSQVSTGATIGVPRPSCKRPLGVRRRGRGQAPPLREQTESRAPFAASGSPPPWRCLRGAVNPLQSPVSNPPMDQVSTFNLSRGPRPGPA